MIAWKYLNKPSATVAALQDYSTMREIINITPQETKALYDRMTSVGGRPLTGIPTSWNPQAGEDRLIKSLDTLDVIQERYRQAVEYMSWFEPAWALTGTAEFQRAAGSPYPGTGAETNVTPAIREIRMAV